jgi:hypothetical protein
VCSEDTRNLWFAKIARKDPKRYKEEEKASWEKSMKGDKKALFKILESVDEVNSMERHQKALFLVHKNMDKVNSDWISSTKSANEV